MKKLALAMCCAAMTGPAGAGLFRPTTYDECVLEHLKGVSSDTGARMVAAGCAKQFPPKKTAKKDAPATTAPVSGQPAAEPNSGIQDLGPFYDQEAPGGGFTNFVPDRAR